ncbi:MAG: COX15/CtaA family protein [Actinomycetota bacterium]|nr:COX15/CtaA family protein [Actinomycetota bacterium]
MGVLSISPETYSKVTRMSLLLLAFIIITGAAVRLSGSGLGCSDWPTCENDQFVAEVDDIHAMVEFINRVITGFVALAVMIAVLGSIFRVPRRRDLTYLSIGLVAGVLVQILVGALVVREHLPPGLVIAHFLISMLLVWNAVELDYRSRSPDRLRKSTSHGLLERLASLLVFCAAVVLVTGTIVTGSGPHSGAESQQTKKALEASGIDVSQLSISELEVERLPFDVPFVARVHGVSMIIFLSVMLLIILLIKKAHGSSLPAAQNLLVAAVVQGAIGYLQYFSDVPALLVGFHVAGATLVWVLTLRLRLFTHFPTVTEQQIETISSKQ